LRESNIEVLGMAAIFTYGFQLATDNFKNANCDLLCLSDYAELLKIANLAEDEQKELMTWRESPSTWRQ